MTDAEKLNEWVRFFDAISTREYAISFLVNLDPMIRQAILKKKKIVGANELLDFVRDKK